MLGAVLLVVSSLRVDDAAASTDAVAPPVATPLASARRTPVLFERAAVAGARFAANAKISADLQRALGPNPGCATAAVDPANAAKIAVFNDERFIDQSPGGESELQFGH